MYVEAARAMAATQQLVNFCGAIIFHNSSGTVQGVNRPELAPFVEAVHNR